MGDNFPTQARSNADMWRCIHRLTSVLEMTILRKRTEEGVLDIMSYAKRSIIEPALKELAATRTSDKGEYVAYSLKEGDPTPQEVIRVSYSTGIASICGGLENGPILFSIGIKLIDESEDQTFLDLCKEKLKQFILEAQQHFDANGNMNGFKRLATLR